MAAASVIRRRWQDRGSEDLANAIDHLLSSGSQSRGERHLHPVASGMVEECAMGHRSSEHLLKAKRLGTELDRCMRAARWADLVLDGVRAVATELHNIGPTSQSESLGPERDPTKDPRIGALRGLPRIDCLVDKPTTNRVDVLVERLLDVDQPALTRTEAEVLEGRDQHLDLAVHQVRPAGST